MPWSGLGGKCPSREISLSKIHICAALFEYVFSTLVGLQICYITVYTCIMKNYEFSFIYETEWELGIQYTLYLTDPPPPPLPFHTRKPSNFKVEDFLVIMWWRFLLELQSYLSVCCKVWNTAGCTASTSCAVYGCCSKVSSFRNEGPALVRNPMVATGLFSVPSYSAIMQSQQWASQLMFSS